MGYTPYFPWMHNDEIAPTVRELIHRHARSMDHVEAALHLADAPNATHEADVIAARYRWGRGIAARVLADLVDSGFAFRDATGYRLAADAVDPSDLAGLADLYHRQPVTLARTIYSAPTPLKPLIRLTPRDGDPPTR